MTLVPPNGHQIPVDWEPRRHIMGEADPRPTIDQFHGPNNDWVLHQELAAWRERKKFGRSESDMVPQSLLPRRGPRDMGMGNVTPGYGAAARALGRVVEAKNHAAHIRNNALDLEHRYDQKVADIKLQNRVNRQYGLPEEPLPARPKIPSLNDVATAGTGKSGGKSVKLPKGVLTAIRGMYGDPTLSKDKVAEIWHQYNARQKFPGLEDFVKGQKGADPAAFQTLYATAIQPYLQQASDKYNEGVDSGYAAMQNILSSSAMPAAERNVLQHYAPLNHANDQKVGALLASQAAQKPLVDDVLNQLQSMISAQNYYANQLAETSGSSGSSSDSSNALLASILKNG